MHDSVFNHIDLRWHRCDAAITQGTRSSTKCMDQRYCGESEGAGRKLSLGSRAPGVWGSVMCCRAEPVPGPTHPRFPAPPAPQLVAERSGTERGNFRAHMNDRFGPLLSGPTPNHLMHSRVHWPLLPFGPMHLCFFNYFFSSVTISWAGSRE